MFHDKISNSIFGGTTQRNRNAKFKAAVSYLIANREELTNEMPMEEIENKIEQIVEHPELFEIYEDKTDFNNVLNQEPVEPVELTKVTEELANQENVKKKLNNSFFNIAKKQIIKQKYKREFE